MDIGMTDILRSTSHLSALQSLRLPRSSAYCDHKVKSKDVPTVCWPANLQVLHLHSSLPDHSIVYFRNLPHTLSRLSIHNCSWLHTQFFAPILQQLGSSLRCFALLVRDGPTRPPLISLNEIISYLPNLTYLRISFNILDHDSFHVVYDNSIPTRLKRIDLHNFNLSLWPGLLQHLTCVLGLGVFKTVRIIGIHGERSDVGGNTDRRNVKDMADLDEMLKALAREDEAATGISEAEAGARRVPEKSFWAWPEKIP